MLSIEELHRCGFGDETHSISYSVQDVRTTLADLCAAADAQDEFDADARQAIAKSAPLEIPLDRVQFILEQLPDSAAAGASDYFSLQWGHHCPRDDRHMQAAESDAGGQTTG